MRRPFVSHIEAAHSALIVTGDLGALGACFRPDDVAHLTDQTITGGHEMVRTFISTVRRAVGDIRIDVEILLQAKDRVAWQRILRATPKCRLKGFPATGRPIVWRDVVTSRFHDDLIAEDWVITDLAERLLLARKR